MGKAAVNRTISIVISEEVRDLDHLMKLVDEAVPADERRHGDVMDVISPLGRHTFKVDTTKSDVPPKLV